MAEGTSMPILADQPDLYPATLLDELPAERADRCWWVLYTKARQEKAVARDLYVRGIPFYLPTVKQPSVRRGRRRLYQAPMFSGYVFLYGSEQERIGTLTTNRVSRVLTVPAPDRLLFDLRQLRRLIDSGAPLTIESLLAPGHRVRVRQGPLMGMEGAVIARRGGYRLLIAVDFLQQGASIEIEDFLLERL
jgi:transcriptional antiterminator RfaH